MRNLDKLLFAILAAVSIITTSCGDDNKNKDPQPVVVQPTKKELLIKEWKTKALIYNGVDIIDDPLSIGYKNGYYIFTDSTYVAFHVSFSHSGPWEFQSNESILTLDPDTPSEVNWTILDLTANSLKLKRGAFVSGNPTNIEWHLIPKQ
ncbi:lipocalin family protein [Adhaeribacter terreus]|uniref:Lipocalin family protein n=1 Tax=Adhaeribacter terreus TaxID=529703 RepID=A0ABW0EFF8_9BACT